MTSSGRKFGFLNGGKKKKCTIKRIKTDVFFSSYNFATSKNGTLITRILFCNVASDAGDSHSRHIHKYVRCWTSLCVYVSRRGLGFLFFNVVRRFVNTVSVRNGLRHNDGGTARVFDDFTYRPLHGSTTTPMPGN